MVVVCVPAAAKHFRGRAHHQQGPGSGRAVGSARDVPRQLGGEASSNRSGLRDFVQPGASTPGKVLHVAPRATISGVLIMRLPQTLRVLLLGLLALVTLSSVAKGQPCGGQWLPGTPPSGVDGTVSVLFRMPNGDIVVGGRFSSAGGQPATNIARWDGTSWSSFGSGLSGNFVSALAVLADGSLVSGGRFTSSGDVALSNIARWDGAGWVPLGSGTDNIVADLAVLPNGDLIAVGWFSVAGGTRVSRVARWDGVTWHRVGLDRRDVPYLLSAVPLANGEFIVAGEFSQIDGVRANNIARWDGTTWRPFGSGVTGLDSVVRALALLPDGSLVAGGFFSQAGGLAARNIARWDGTSWQTFGQGNYPYGAVYAMSVASTGKLIVAGQFQAFNDAPAFNTVEWDGQSWRELPGCVSDVVFATTSTSDGAFIVGGEGQLSVFSETAGAWQPLGGGWGGSVYRLQAMPDGSLVAGGFFNAADGVAARGIATWDGIRWRELGGGIGGRYSWTPFIGALLPDGSGGLFVGGSFSSAGEVSVFGLAHWDGSSWSSVGDSPSDTVIAMVRGTDGTLFVGGNFGSFGDVPANSIGAWNGTSWTQVGNGLPLGVGSLTRLGDGRVVAAGGFTSAGGHLANRIAVWDGSDW